MSQKRKLKQLAWREYLPMSATIAMWAAVVAAIGHADTARLLAATSAVRTVQLMTRLATPMLLRQRIGAPREIRRQAKRFAFNLQAAALAVALLLLVLIVEGTKAIGQGTIAAFIPFLALGMPARYLRMADVRTASPYFRLALAVGGLALVLLAWASGLGVVAFAFALGMRHWIAYAAIRWWPRPAKPPRVTVAEPLHFSEVASYSAIVGRRLLTYRLTKLALTVLGPFGTAAARTGRGLKWHQKLEPYLPHHLGGFILFSMATLGSAIILALRSGEPAAMVGASGLLQLGAASAHVVLLWRWLPSRHDISVPDDDDDDE